MTLYINIGSNQGDRYAQIEQAVALIANHWSQAKLRRSDYVESESWGYKSPHLFLNLGLALDFNGKMPNPLEILHQLQDIEREICNASHRNEDGTYADRNIDIDIIAIDNIRLRAPRLQIPHPRAHLRDFVMLPLRQLAPESVIEGLH